MLSQTYPVSATLRLPFRTPSKSPEEVLDRLRFHANIPIKIQKQFEREFKCLLRRCCSMGVDINHIRRIDVLFGNVVCVKKRRLGYRITIPEDGRRWLVTSKNLFSECEGTWRNYAIVQVMALIFLAEAKTQLPDFYQRFKQAFVVVHKSKKQEIVRYLNVTNLCQKKAKITYFRLTGRMTSWYRKHMDSVALGYSDHRSMKNWRSDCAGLTAQVFALGLPGAIKAYGGIHRKLGQQITNNQHELQHHPVRKFLNGSRSKLTNENRKLEARRNAVGETIVQIRLIDALLKQHF